VKFTVFADMGMPYMETNAKTGENVKQLFETLLHMIYECVYFFSFKFFTSIAFFFVRIGLVSHISLGLLVPGLPRHQGLPSSWFGTPGGRVTYPPWRRCS